MKNIPNLTATKIDALRLRHSQLKPILDAEMNDVQKHWEQYIENDVHGLTDVVASHSKDIEAYIRSHGPMTADAIVDKALTEFFAHH